MKLLEGQYEKKCYLFFGGLLIAQANWLNKMSEKGGRIATNNSTFNRELLIVEKKNDGKPFELHTSFEDKENYYRNLRNPWLLILLMFVIFTVMDRSLVFGVFALISLFPVIIYQMEIMKVRYEAKTKEW